MADVKIEGVTGVVASGAKGAVSSGVEGCTREWIEANYVVRDGVIRSPGKFEGEPVWAPHYYALALAGFADDRFDDGGGIDWHMFHIDASDVERWPELAGAESVALWETETGFVLTAVTP